MSLETLDAEIIVVGGGAAGLTAAQYGARANLKTLLIEEMAPGGQALIIDDLENYPGFPEKISGFDFTQRFTQQALNFGAEITNATVNSIKKEGNVFVLDTTKGEKKAFAVILATGAKHRKLGVPGEETYSGKGVSYCATCDGPFFRGKKMLVVGGGDAACDEALFLSKLSDNIVMVHRRDRFRAQKALAGRVLDNKRIDVRFNHEVVEIGGDGKKVTSVKLLNNADNSQYEEDFAAVFIFVGSLPQTALAENLEKDEAGYLITDQEMRTSLPGFYVVGDVRATPFRQLIVAAGEGAVASHSAAQYIDALEGNSYD
ncbi:MAG: thioredoxin-disulfide reductase [Spirochaetia bacterium]|nr:thioredoxin-disulfide reductase [Spirochaetia bacterium]